MPYIQRQLSSKEIAIHLARAKWLKAQGMEIEIPEEWRFETRARLQVRIAPSPDSAVYALPDGKVCYAIGVHLVAKKSGMPFPEFEIATSWDKQIAVENFDNAEHYVDFADQIYPIEDVLNVRAGECATLPSGRAVLGLLLCTGSRAIPRKFRHFSAADCAVMVRDPGTGEILETVVTQIAVMRSRKSKAKSVRIKGSLYAPDPDSARPGDKIIDGRSPGATSKTPRYPEPRIAGEVNKQNGSEEADTKPE